MEFLLSTEHRELQASLRTFFQKVAPTDVISELDRTETYPKAIYKQMADFDLCGVTVAEEFGGNPADEMSMCLITEEIARAGACLAYLWAPSVTFCARGIDKYGTDQQRADLLPGVVKGDITFAMGLTEPEVGSDLAHLSTLAVRDGDDYLINGQKVFTTGADTADYIFLFVRTDATATASKGLSVLLVPPTAPGVTVRKLRKLSGQGTHTCEVFLDNVRVPQTALVGREHFGAEIIFSLLDAERIYVGAQSCGIAQGAFDVAVRYANERIQFGKPIIEHQAVAHMLADMATEIEMIRLLTWRAAWKLEQGLPCNVDASMVKIAGPETATRVVSRAMQVLGGYSYTTDFPLERYWRECKLNEIAGGTSQVQRNIIAKSLTNKLGRPVASGSKA